jgi:molybdopterin converting factor small subunit
MSSQHITIRVQFVGPDLATMAGEKEVDLSLSAETSLDQLAGLLLSRFGKAADILVDSDIGKFRPRFRVLHNGKYVHTEDQGHIFLKDGDTVLLMLAVSGGQ